MVSAVTSSSSAAAALAALKQAQLNVFKKADKNGDSQISLDEFKAAGTAQAQAQGSTVDTSALEKAFAQIDTDHSGGLSFDEISAEAQKRLASLQTGGISSDNVLQLAQSGDTSAKDDFAAKFLAKADTDGDGKLSAAEFAAAKPADAPADGPSSAEIFKAKDADGDGSLSLSELQQGAPGPGGPRRSSRSRCIKRTKRPQRSAWRPWRSSSWRRRWRRYIVFVQLFHQRSR